ncbi:MAG: hypothetical protein ABR568_03770 [Pyrinomonadaceae bacterium]
MNYLLKCWLTILVLMCLSCGPSSAVDQQPPASKAQPSPISPEQEPTQVNSVFVEGDTLSYGGYDVVKLNKKVKLEQTSGLTEVSYALLKRKGKVLEKFDGVYFGVGNATDFGLFPFLGGEAKQLVVSQTIPRGGRHWVVNLSPDFRLVYDSGAYRVGREDLGVLDIDKDGRYEILQEITAFYGFDHFSSSETPLPLVVFKYDEKAEKYLPANHLFQEYALKGIESEITSLSPDEKEYLSKRLDIALRYVFAGKEEKAWAFFDREYKQPDKDKVKSQVKALLTEHPVYRFIYSKRAT